MAQGKETCRILKDIRRQIAAANHIEFVTSECRFKGDCLGTCPKCEAEVRFLEQQLRARTLAGKAVALAGISAAYFAMLMPLSSQAQTLPDINVQNTTTDSITANRDRVKGIVKGKTQSDSIAKVLAGACIKNLTDKSLGTCTNFDGEFETRANKGDLLEVAFLGFLPKTVCVNDPSEPIEVVLDENEDFDSITGITVVAYGKPLILKLDIVDAKGKHIKSKDVDIYRLSIDENGDNKEDKWSPTKYDEKDNIIFHLNDLNGNWPFQYDDEFKPLKEVTLLIKAEGYEPVKTQVKYPKSNTKKTIKLKSTKK